MVCVDISLARSARKAYKADQAAARYLEIVKTAWWCWEAYEGLCALSTSNLTEASRPYQLMAVSSTRRRGAGTKYGFPEHLRSDRLGAT